MCLSAPVSFVASGVLTVTGVAILKRRPLRRERLFAIIPFLFAFQQLLEGFQWLVMKSNEPNLLLGYAFLFFAFLLWPTYIPISIYMMEHKKKHAHILRLFIVAGLLATIYLLLNLLKYPLDISVAGNSIRYFINIPLDGNLVFIYVAITCGSCFISSDRHIRWFGWAALISFLVSFFFFRITLTSTWCFFAAILSLLIYFHFTKKAHGRSKKTKKA
tara:strand:+ start:393 stop:1043 length:651 start_codon:yes stop_codon:yes gene_type:complete